MKKYIVLAVMAVCLGGATWVMAHDEKDMKGMKMPKTSAEFNMMKKLVGNWKGMSSHMGGSQGPEPAATQFRLTSGGSAIEETLGPGTPHEMVDMYHDEAGRLVMTHYCAIGNQPHMVLKEAGPHMISFEMRPTPGINPQETHMHALVLEMPDADHLTERWTNYVNGKPGETAVLTMARVK